MEKEDVYKINKKNLKYSIKDGVATSIMEGAGNSYISPFAIAMNASSSQVGFLTSLPNLLGPFSQLYSNKLLKKYSRKKILLISILIQALMWLPIALIPFLFKENISVWLIIFFFSLCFIFGSLGSPIWNSWMKDIVPEKTSGEFFGKRNSINGFVLLTTSLIASFFLDYFRKDKSFLGVKFVLVGFSVLFLIAMISRLTARYFISKKLEPEFLYDEKSYFSLKDFVKRLKKSNFGKFVLYLSLFHIGVNIVGPFFNIYMLRNLGFNYVTFISMSVASSLASALFLPGWGRIADKYGTIKVLKTCGILASLIPILWLFTKNPFLLIFVNAFGGIAWAGFNLCASNFVYDVARREKMALCVTYQNIFTGVGIFLGATIGGLLMAMPKAPLFGNVFLFICLISGILRFSLTFIFWNKFKEVRQVEEKPVLEIMGMGFNPNRGFMRTTFLSVNNKLKEQHEKIIKKIKK